jgi:hypothetical protein
MELAAMKPVLQRCFLFLLLVVDWAGDPHMGRSPLSRPMSSQEVFCKSLHNHDVYVTQVAESLKNTLLHTLTLPLSVSGSWDRDCMEAPGLAFAQEPLFYVYMSLRC